MRRLITLLALATMFGVMMVGVAQADPDPDRSSPNSASIDRGFGCAVFDGDGNIVPVAEGDGSLSIITTRHHTTLKCTADVINPTGKAQVQRGFSCSTFIGLTNDSHSIVSASGKSKLTCRLDLHFR